MTNFDRLCVTVKSHRPSWRVRLAARLNAVANWLRAESGPVCILIAVLAGCPFVAGYVGGGF